MTLFSDLPFYKATYDLLLAIFRFTKDFSKDYKYTVGESIKKETIELLIMIFRMNNSIEPNETLTKGFVQLGLDVETIIASAYPSFCFGGRNSVEL